MGARQYTNARPNDDCAATNRCAATYKNARRHYESDVTEAATNETNRVAAIPKKIIYACNGWHGSYSRRGERRKRPRSIAYGNPREDLRRNWRRRGKRTNVQVAQEDGRPIEGRRLRRQRTR